MTLPRFRLAAMRHWPDVIEERADLRALLRGSVLGIPAPYGRSGIDCTLTTLEALLDPPSGQGIEVHETAPEAAHDETIVIHPTPALLGLAYDERGSRRVRDLLINFIGRRWPDLGRGVMRVADDPLTVERFVDAALPVADQGLEAVLTAGTAGVLATLLVGVPAPVVEWVLTFALPGPPQGLSGAAQALGRDTARQIAYERGLVSGYEGDTTFLRPALLALGRGDAWPEVRPAVLWRAVVAAIAPEATGPLTARLKDSLGLDPPPAETPHRDLLTRLVALATPLPDRPRLLLLHGAPGSGRSALARAVAHHVPLESIWLTFAHRPHRGWAPTAWATNDILPGRPWKVPPPPWLESLFDLLEARPRLYIIEDADAVASADLLAWLPRRNAVVVLITLRNLRPPGSPEIHRFAVEAGASVEVSAVEANLLATAAHFGALTRAALAAAAGVEVGEVSAGIARGFLALQPEARVRAAHPRPLRLDGAQLAASTRRLADHLLKSGEGVPDEPLVGTVLENLRGLCRGGTPADFHLAGQVVDRLIESQPLQPLAHDLVEVAAELAEWMVDHAATHFDLVRLGRLLKLLGRLDQAAATLRAADEAEQTPLVAIHLWNIARERGDEVEQARLLELIAGRSTHAEARVRAFLLLIHSDVGADSTAELPAVLADLRKELVTHYSVGGVAILIELLRIADQPADADRALDTLRRRFPCALNLRSPRRGGDAQKALRWAEANGEVGYVRWHDIPVADHRRWAELYRRALAELPLDDEDRLQATGRLLLVAREHPELAPELVPLALSALERFQFPKGQWAQKAQGWRQEAADILKPKPKSKPQLPQPAPPPTFIDLFKDFFKL